jgi:hypothetical protein
MDAGSGLTVNHVSSIPLNVLAASRIEAWRSDYVLLLRSELIMTLGAIVESIRKALDGQVDDVKIDRRGDETLIQVFVGKQLFLVKCSEPAPDKDAPAIT